MSLLKKITLTLSTSFSLIIALPWSVQAQTEVPEIDAGVAFAVDYDTGKILLNQRGDEQEEIASMTKMIVEYLLFEAIESGETTWDAQVPISDYASKISLNYDLSNVPLRTDETYSVRELYEAIAIYSANSATIAIAEYLGGSEPAFVDDMQAKVEKWGITDAKLVNSTGLNNDYIPEEERYPNTEASDENMMSARSMIVVAIHLLNNYPQVLETAGIPELTFREGTVDETQMINYNWMLPNLPYHREGVSGLKSGTTEASGANLTATAVEGDRRIVAVIMDAGDGLVNKAQRFVEMERILDYAFLSYRNLTVPAATFDGRLEVPVANGTEPQVSLKATNEMVVTLPSGKNPEDLEVSLEENPNLFNEDGALMAPFEAETQVGQLIAAIPEDSLGFLDTTQKGYSIPAYTVQGMKEVTGVERILQKITDFFKNIFTMVETVFE